jgi:fumarate hydratase class II
MNVNEVIAGRANELLTGKRGGKSPVHPNDHVNLGQSSNDVIPSAIHIAALLELKNRLLPRSTIHGELNKKSEAFRDASGNRPHSSAGCGSRDSGPGVQRTRDRRNSPSNG